MTKSPAESIIYLDHHATTPLDPRVFEVMKPYLLDHYGNAASLENSYGGKAEQAVEKARAQAARLIGAASDEIIFTSGATESNNLALKGVAEMFSGGQPHIMTQQTEHKSVLDTCAYLQTRGVDVTYLSVDKMGRLDLEEVKKAIRKDTVLISVMMANNEIGTLQPVEEIGKLAKEKQIYFHCDAAQTAGKLSIDVQRLGIDLLSFSSHKMYGPKGSAALFVRKKNPRVRLSAQMHGGGQESGLRSGTLNVPAIVGFGEACEIALREMREDEMRVRGLRDHFLELLRAGIPEMLLHGDVQRRLYFNLNISLPGIEAEPLLKLLAEKIAVSSGSACVVKSKEPSYVLKAIGVPEDQIHTAVRFGFGKFNSQTDAELAAEHVIRVYRHLKEISPFRAMR